MWTSRALGSCQARGSFDFLIWTLSSQSSTSHLHMQTISCYGRICDQIMTVTMNDIGSVFSTQYFDACSCRMRHFEMMTNALDGTRSLRRRDGFKVVVCFPRASASCFPLHTSTLLRVHPSALRKPLCIPSLHGTSSCGLRKLSIFGGSKSPRHYLRNRPRRTHKHGRDRPG